MNDLLQHMIDQSTIDILGVKTVDQRRFAELIVQECVDIAQAGLSPAVAKTIQTRFGADHE